MRRGGAYGSRTYVYNRDYGRPRKVYDGRAMARPRHPTLRQVQSPPHHHRAPIGHGAAHATRGGIGRNSYVLDPRAH